MIAANNYLHDDYDEYVPVWCQPKSEPTPQPQIAVKAEADKTDNAKPAKPAKLIKPLTSRNADSRWSPRFLTYDIEADIAARMKRLHEAAEIRINITMGRHHESAAKAKTEEMI